ncbi:Transcription factor CBF/NF-Y/archaeal histone domain [Dillenia turbinata]|uniref:Transcription factor CBF/NF-Y/archaeal histone domain n=1 Tax=Dillenia turbinata TaxID=194707 RepID=A0AAN8VKZ5_9MAGN
MASRPASAQSRRARSRTNDQKQQRVTNSKVKNEPPIVLVIDSSSTSEEKEKNHQQRNKEDEEEEEMESKSGAGDNLDRKSSDKMLKKKQKSPKQKQEKQKKQKQKQGEEDDNVEKKSENNLYKFPMYRVERIIRSENPDYRISQEAVYVINKAAEMFVEIFSEDAHAASVKDRKKLIDYKHLSSVVCKRRRLDFLSDFVPERLKAEDALARAKTSGT